MLELTYDLFLEEVMMVAFCELNLQKATKLLEIIDVIDKILKPLDAMGLAF